MTIPELKKILYAEDESDIKEIAKISLENIGGYEVGYCANGKEAIRLLNSFNPDLFLIDVMMPEMDGLMTLQEIRKLPEHKEKPIIFMTAKTQPNEIENYKTMGAFDVIIKPFDPMKLSDVLNKIWQNYWNHYE